jgi:hypothetical protein
MELSNPSIPANTAHSINPKDVVEQVKLFAGAYGLDKGKAMFESVSSLMSFLPWWDAEVKIPVYTYFKDERERLQREQDERELKKARASAPQQPIIINQPQASSGIAMPFVDGAKINQVNIVDSGANVTYTDPTCSKITRRIKLRFAQK